MKSLNRWLLTRKTNKKELYRQYLILVAYYKGWVVGDPEYWLTKSNTKEEWILFLKEVQRGLQEA